MTKLSNNETIGKAGHRRRDAGLTTLVRETARPVDVVAFERSVVSFFIDAADILGVPKSLAAIYGICFANARPLSFADIEERLDISKGSVSQGLRILNDMGALKKVGNHDRRDYFAPELAMRKLAIRYIEDRLETQLANGRSRLELMRASLPSMVAADDKELRVRIKALQAWSDKSRGLIPAVKAFLRLG